MAKPYGVPEIGISDYRLSNRVSAFATANGVIMGQLKTENKSNEITAIPKLIDLLDIKGCLVTLDAMGCQIKIAKKIIAQGGDYLLSVKENQAT